MTKIIHRRDFLKLAGAASAGLALSACGVKATELPEPTVTAFPSLTPIPPTATLTNTPAPAATLGTPTTLKEIAQRHGIIIAGDYSRDDKSILPYLPQWINANFNGVFMEDVRPIQLRRAIDDNTGDNGWEYVQRVTKVLKEMQLPSIWYFLAEPGRFEHLKTLEAFKYHAGRTLDEIKYVGEFVYWNAFNEPGDGGYDPTANPLVSWLGKDWLYQLYLILDELALERGLTIGKDFAVMVNLFLEPSMTDVMRKDHDFVTDTNIRLGNSHAGWMVSNQVRWAHDGKLSGRDFIEPSSTEEIFKLCDTLAEINPQQPIVLTELQAGQNDTPQQGAEILGKKIGEIIRWSDEKKSVGQFGVAALSFLYFLTTCYQPENIQFCYGNVGFFDTAKGQLTDAGHLLIETINAQLTG